MGQVDVVGLVVARARDGGGGSGGGGMTRHLTLFLCSTERSTSYRRLHASQPEGGVRLAHSLGLHRPSGTS